MIKPLDFFIEEVDERRKDAWAGKKD